MIPYGHQSIDEEDIAAVVAVLRGDWLTQGPEVGRFEDAVAGACGARYAVAFSSGTAALHGAAVAGELGPGDTVVTSPLSFAASANCARYVGATPAFVDVEPGTLNLDPGRVGPCDGLVAVHYAGLPVDLSRLEHRPRVVIEDAAHALGARTPSGPVGNCAHSDMCVFSFHPVKVVTTGEGGAVTTNSPELAERLRAFRNHGIVRPSDREPWFYDVATTGYNYRITDLQAALGVSQLGRLAEFVERRGMIAARYGELLGGAPVRFPPEPPVGVTHARHLYPVQVPAADRRRIFEGLRSRGIGVQVHYIPIYRHTVFRDLGVDPARFPAVEQAYAGLISLPIFPDLSDGNQNSVVDALLSLL